MDPVDPVSTAFADRMVMRPEDDTAPAPLTTLTTPPVDAAEVVAPADTYTLPPSPLAAVPTDTDTEPETPLTEVPVIKTNDPT